MVLTIRRNLREAAALAPMGLGAECFSTPYSTDTSKARSTEVNWSFAIGHVLYTMTHESNYITFTQV